MLLKLLHSSPHFTTFLLHPSCYLDSLFSSPSSTVVAVRAETTTRVPLTFLKLYVYSVLHTHSVRESAVHSTSCNPCTRCCKRHAWIWFWAAWFCEVIFLHHACLRSCLPSFPLCSFCKNQTWLWQSSSRLSTVLLLHYLPWACPLSRVFKHQACLSNLWLLPQDLVWWCGLM